jgi:hypothetical protein
MSNTSMMNIEVRQILRETRKLLNFCASSRLTPWRPLTRFAHRDSPSWHGVPGAFPRSTLAPLDGNGMNAATFTPWPANLLYDLVCGDAWAHITQNMAQDVGGQRRGRHIMRRHWERFAVEAGLTPRLVIAEIRKLGG